MTPATISPLDMAQVWANFMQGFPRYVILNSMLLGILVIHQMVDWWTGCHAARKDGAYKSSIGDEGIKKKAFADMLLLPLGTLDVGFRAMQALAGDSVAQSIWELICRVVPKFSEFDPSFFDLGIGSMTIIMTFFIVNELSSIFENEEKIGNDIPNWAKTLCGFFGRKLDGGTEITKKPD